MKIAQYYDQTGKVRVGVVEGDMLQPLGFHRDMIDLILNGPGLERAGNPLPLGPVQLAPPVTRPSKIIAIGLNYVDHIQESKGEPPERPLLFAKFPNSLVGHGSRITWSREITKKVDFEAELTVVMGRTVRSCPEEDAVGAIFGYTCGNDVSARDLQFGDGQWVRGKSLDTFCPIGPWIVTSEEISDPHALRVASILNGKTMQEGNTGSMLFKIPHLVSFISKHFTLLPGDLILTGTPSGVGAFRDPPVYMKDGDEIVIEIEGIGRLVNTCSVRE
ncbi:MAG: fumarylacetoacetate hydrolase family protein [Deltaproteobacteria bacterium]|nr:fumarylacetoacetate hydrolase family protein [Deltaproteobacteria bacterium]MBW2136993.1 fumarylacetoacetate hydrolase family protein [Deltaproteobacteria bacterium]